MMGEQYINILLATNLDMWLVKSALDSTNQVAHQAVAFPSISSLKERGVFLLLFVLPKFQSHFMFFASSLSDPNSIFPGKF